jgi:NIPSNAP protein
MRTKLLTAVALLLTGYAVGRVSSAPVAAQAAGHVYELRTYTAVEGKLPNVVARFRDHTRQIFDKHNMKSIGYWTPLEAPTAPTAPAASACPSPLPDTTLIYILEHPSREEARKNWAAFSADPEWQKAKAESEAAGKIVAKAESVFLNPTDFSPIK